MSEQKQISMLDDIPAANVEDETLWNLDPSVRLQYSVRNEFRVFRIILRPLFISPSNVIPRMFRCIPRRLQHSVIVSFAPDYTLVVIVVFEIPSDTKWRLFQAQHMQYLQVVNYKSADV